MTLANNCPNGNVQIVASVDHGEHFGNLVSFNGGPGTFKVQLEWPERHVPLLVLNEPGAPETHTLQVATVGTPCPGATLNSVSFDVIGTR